MSAPSLQTELSGIEGLVLDVDDTIVDTRAAMLAAGAVAVTHLWPERADPSVLAQRYYRDPAGCFRRYAAGEMAFEQMRLARLVDVAEHHGLPVPGERELAAFEAAYAPAFATSQRLLPGALELVAAARSRGLAVGLLTNSAAAPTQVKLDALGLAGAFDAVVTRDTLGIGKPDPRVYLHACSLLAIEPARAVCVGDSLEWDVLGAQAAGLRAVWLEVVDPVHHALEPVPSDVVRVSSLHEIAEALGRFGPTRSDE